VKRLTLFFLLTLFLLFSSKGEAAAVDLLINEFVSDTPGTVVDPDWVEIYNSSDGILDLSLYRLEDEASNTKTLSGNLNPKSWATFDWSNRLNKDGDTIYLREKVSGNTIDSVKYGSGGVIGAPGPGKSAGRMPDGADNWVIFDNPTKGTANFVALTPTPTEIPTPTLTETPLPIPTETPTPLPTSTPVLPSPTSSPTVTPTPTFPQNPCDWFCQKGSFFQRFFLKFLFGILRPKGA